MHLHILHRTTFSYAGPAHESVNEARLRPVDDATQLCQEFELTVVPAAAPRAFDDFFGNTVHYFEIFDRHTALIVEAVSNVTTVPTAERPPIPRVTTEELFGSPEHQMLAEFYTDSPFVPLDDTLRREAETAFGAAAADVWERVCRAGEHVHRSFTYRPNSTDVDTVAGEALRHRQGVCQDFAHVHLGLCRTVGIPARYVSGYFFDDRRRPGQPEASHAWIEAWLPGHGWAAFDATHSRVADERYVKVATGRDYGDIRPVNGTYRGAPTRSLEVDVSVRRASPSLIGT